MKMSANGGHFLLDCFVTLAMTKELKNLSLRASVSDAWQSSELVLRVAHKHCSLRFAL